MAIFESDVVANKLQLEECDHPELVYTFSQSILYVFVCKCFFIDLNEFVHSVQSVYLLKIRVSSSMLENYTSASDINCCNTVNKQRKKSNRN